MTATESLGQLTPTSVDEVLQSHNEVASAVIVGGEVSLYYPDGGDETTGGVVLLVFNGTGNMRAYALPADFDYFRALDWLVAFVKQDNIDNGGTAR